MTKEAQGHLDAARRAGYHVDLLDEKVAGEEKLQAFLKVEKQFDDKHEHGSDAKQLVLFGAGSNVQYGVISYSSKRRIPTTKYIGSIDAPLIDECIKSDLTMHKITNGYMKQCENC